MMKGVSTLWNETDATGYLCTGFCVAVSSVDTGSAVEVTTSSTDFGVAPSWWSKLRSTGRLSWSGCECMNVSAAWFGGFDRLNPTLAAISRAIMDSLQARRDRLTPCSSENITLDLCSHRDCHRGGSRLQEPCEHLPRLGVRIQLTASRRL